MLRVNVGLSRKLSKDYNSTGYSINLDGEITAAVADAEAVVEQVKELFDLAEEALDQQIQRERSTTALASHDLNNNGSNQASRDENRGTSNGNGHAHSNGDSASTEDLATNKQVKYLLSLAKEQRLSTLELEHKIAEIVGYQTGVYDLTKKAAGAVIDALTGKTRNGKAPARN